MADSARARAEACSMRYALRLPILLAPMAGACPPEAAAMARPEPAGALVTRI